MILIRIIEMIIGNAFITIVSIRLFYFIRSKITYFDIAIFGFIWIYLASLYTLLIGILGLLNSHKIAIISLLGIIILIAFRKIPKFKPNLSKLFIGFKPSLLEIILYFLAFIQIVRIIVHIWYIPPYVWDTVVYHLVNVAEWVQKGKILPVITPVDRVYWPASFELLEAWFTVFLHNDLLIKVAPFLYYLLTGASAYAIARTLSLNRTLSMAVVVFYLYTPSLAIQATACKNDVGISAVYLLSIAILLNILKNGVSDEFPLHRQLIIVLIAQLLGIGIKPYMAFIVPAPLIIGAIALYKLYYIKRESKPSWNRLKDFIKGNQKAYISIIVFFIISGLFFGSYWYMRNWIVFGNPFHPTDFRIGDHLISGTGNAVQFGPGQRGSASLKGLLDNIKTIITVRIFDKSSAYNSSLGDITGWGWFNFACGLPAIIYGLIFVKYLRLIIIAFIISLIGLLTFITTDPWFMRFTMWFPIIFSLSFVLLISRIRYKWIRGILLAFALICTVLNWIAVLNVGEISVDDFQKMMSLPVLKRSTAELTHHYDGAFKKALEIIPKDEAIGVCFPNNGWAYPLYDSDYSRHIIYIPISDIQFVNNMKDKNIKYLFIERITQEQTDFIQNAVKAGYMAKIEEFLYALK